VTALVVNFQTEIDDVLFADLKIVGHVFAVDGFTPATFVEAEFGVDECAMVFDEPVDAVERAAAFFVGGERDDDVTVWNEAFLFELD